MKKKISRAQPYKQQVVTTLWTVIFLAAIVNLLLLLLINSNLHAQTNDLRDQQKIHALVDHLTTITISSTDSIEKYAFTLNSKYLQAYWTEIEIDKSLDKTLAQLTTYIPSGPLQETLNTIKNSYENLRVQDIRTLKLIFTAYHIPDQVIAPKIMAYRLTGEEELMSDSEKLALARSNLFSENYEGQISILTQAIATLRQQLHDQLEFKIHRTTTLLYILVALHVLFSIASIILIGSLLWLRLLNAKHYPDVPLG
jgi:hypothetical protein